MYRTIVLPTRAQVDTIAAIFILKKFGEEKFPGIAEADVEVWQIMPQGETDASLDKKGVILIDLGGGRFDHHGKPEQITATQLVCDYLGIADDPAFAKILEFTERDDFFGKGTVSADPLDRAFGLAGLTTSLNRLHAKDPAAVVSVILPFFEGHYEEERQRTHELPEEFKKREEAGEVKTFTVRQRDKNLKVVMILSDNLSMSGYLRSKNGGAFDIVAQWLSSGHMNVLTRPTKKVDLRMLVAMIRKEEITRSGRELRLTLRDLSKPARLKEVPEWYYDPATNSIQNGGVNPKEISPTKIPKSEFLRILEEGLSFKE